MFVLRDGIAYGVSGAPDKSAVVAIWMDNQTDKPQIMYVCCNATFVRHIDLYDQSGQRIPSKIEIANAKAGSGALQSGELRNVEVCEMQWMGHRAPPFLESRRSRGALKRLYARTRPLHYRRICLFTSERF